MTVSSISGDIIILQGEDILHNGIDIYHGLVRKLVISEGTGREIGETDAEVTCTLDMYLHRPRSTSSKEDEPNQMISDLQRVCSHDRNKPFVRKVTNILPLGLQKAVSTMTAGERAGFWVDPLMGFGSSGLDIGEGEGSTSVPADTALVFEIGLISFREPELTGSGVGAGKRLRFESMPIIQEELDKAQELLDKGNRQAAQRQWCKTIRNLERMRIDGVLKPEQDSTRKEILLDVLKIAGENALEIGWYKLAVTYNRYVIQLDSHNSYAHYLLGRAYFALGCNSSAKYFMLRAKFMDIGNSLYAQKLDEIQRHSRLMHDDSDDSDDELEAFEVLADVIEEQLINKQRKIIEEVNRQIKCQLKMYLRNIVIEGGFDESILEEISNRLVKHNKGSDSVIVKRLIKGIEIIIP